MKFQPGQSGNPNGRPKGTQALSDNLRSLLAQKTADGRTNGDLIVSKLVEKAQAGEIDALKVILDRVDGKVPERKEVTGSEGGPLLIRVVYDDAAGTGPATETP